MAAAKQTINRHLRREGALFIGLFFVGLVILPIAIYLVGDEVFGEYGGNGFGGFFGAMSSRIRNGELVSWFLALSPYLAWQFLRLCRHAWRQAGRVAGGNDATQA